MIQVTFGIGWEGGHREGLVDATRRAESTAGGRALRADGARRRRAMVLMTSTTGLTRLSGRTALVTGGASGIGLAIARSLKSEGVRVVLADRDESELASAGTELGPGADTVLLDVTDRRAWVALREQLGTVDILVNNAGIGPDGRALADVEPKSFDRLVEIKVTGTFNGIHTFAAAMRQRREGYIVNTASMAGLTASAGLGPYTTAKFAVVGMSEVLRAEMEPFGVGVSVLCPGLIKTRLRQTTRAAGYGIVNRPDAAANPGIDPETVGGIVVDGIRQGRFYLVTHGEYQDAVATRMRQVVAAFDGVPRRNS